MGEPNFTRYAFSVFSFGCWKGETGTGIMRADEK